MDGHRFWANQLAGSIAPRWRKDFAQFVTGGEASDKFLSHLKSCQRCLPAAERACQELAHILVNENRQAIERTIIIAFNR